jgi:ubiquinone biosynthesis protein UbiJ
MASVLTPIEYAINTALNQDAETKALLSQFEGKQITIVLTDINYTVTTRFNNSHITLTNVAADEASLTVSAKTLTLIRVGQDPDKLFSADVNIHGDVQFAKQLQDVLEHFEFDWEALLANYTGDTLAYPIAHGLRQLGAWLNNNHQSTQMTIAEYLKEEVRLLPDKAEVNPFLNQIDILRADSDRLEAKIQRLEGLIK